MSAPTPREAADMTPREAVDLVEASIPWKLWAHSPELTAAARVTLDHARAATGQTGAGERADHADTLARVVWDLRQGAHTLDVIDDVERVRAALRTLAAPPPQITRQAVIEAVRQEASRDEIALAGVRARLLAMLIADRLGLTEENHDG